MEFQALASFILLSHIACGRECLFVYIFPPSFLSLSWYLRCFCGYRKCLVWACYHARWRLGPGLGLWGINLTKILDPGLSVCVTVGDLARFSPIKLVLLISLRHTKTNTRFSLFSWVSCFSPKLILLVVELN